MSTNWRLCTCLLILVLLLPAISTTDDAISLSAFRPVESSGDDSLAAVRHLAKYDFDATQATLLERLENLQVVSACVLHVEISSTAFHLIESAEGCNRNVTVPVGRAPPTA